MNPGKVFESDVMKSLQLDTINFDRFKDPMGSRSGVRNICDLLAFYEGTLIYMELKSTQENTLNFKSSITRNQYEGLLSKTMFKGVYPAILVQYTNHNEVYLVHIKDVQKLIEEEGKKSLHIEDARIVGTRVESTRKRTRFTYNMKQLFEGLVKTYG